MRPRIYRPRTFFLYHTSRGQYAPELFSTSLSGGGGGGVAAVMLGRDRSGRDCRGRRPVILNAVLVQG